MDKLFGEFSSSTYQDWKQATEKTLKGKPLENLNKIIQGIEVHPYYNTPLNLSPIVGNRQQNNWLLFQQIKGLDAKSINGNILNALMNGVNAIEINAQDNYNVALNKVLLEHISIYLVSEKGIGEMQIFADYIKTQGFDKKNILGGFIQLQDFGNNWEQHTEERVQFGITHLPCMKTIFIFAKAETIIENLAINLSKVNEYLNLLIPKGYSVETIIGQMQIHFEVNSNYFFEIAKLRAFKKLFVLLTSQYDNSVQKLPFISVNTKIETNTVEVDYKNILRTTTQAMSAIIGGCDSLSITPFDGEDSDFSLRIARNIQLIEQEESYLDRVVDPAAGSYYVEQITNELAEKAWDKFKEMETNGGFVASLKKGTVNA